MFIRKVIHKLIVIKSRKFEKKKEKNALMILYCFSGSVRVYYNTGAVCWSPVRRSGTEHQYVHPGHSLVHQTADRGFPQWTTSHTRGVGPESHHQTQYTRREHVSGRSGLVLNITTTLMSQTFNTDKFFAPYYYILSSDLNLGLFSENEMRCET